MRGEGYLKSVVAVWAVAAMLIVSFISHEHLHSASTSGTGHLVKHWYYGEDHSVRAGVFLDQDDHHTDSAVEIVFKSGAQFIVIPPALIAGALFASPEHLLLGYSQTDILLIAHGPPRLLLPSRSPPLSVSPSV